MAKQCTAKNGAHTCALAVGHTNPHLALLADGATSEWTGDAAAEPPAVIVTESDSDYAEPADDDTRPTRGRK